MVYFCWQHISVSLSTDFLDNLPKCTVKFFNWFPSFQLASFETSAVCMYVTLWFSHIELPMATLRGGIKGVIFTFLTSSEDFIFKGMSLQSSWKRRWCLRKRIKFLNSVFSHFEPSLPPVYLEGVIIIPMRWLRFQLPRTFYLFRWRQWWEKTWKEIDEY